jgi:hypothetical protein
MPKTFELLLSLKNPPSVPGSFATMSRPPSRELANPKDDDDAKPARIARASTSLKLQGYIALQL